MHKLIFVPIMVLCSIVTYSQSEWKVAYDDTRVKIEYQLADCNDPANGFNFQYHLIKIENKTKRSLNVQYLDGATSAAAGPDELTSNLILSPGEIRQGNCNDPSTQLKSFARNNASEGKAKPFLISNIKIYEL